MPIINNISQLQLRTKAIGCFNNQRAAKAARCSLPIRRVINRSHYPQFQALLIPLLSNSESPAPSSSSRKHTSSASVLLPLLLLLGNISTGEAMENGKSPRGEKANDFSPPILGKEGNATFSCSGFRLNSQQVMTAKHCIKSEMSVLHNKTSIIANHTLSHPTLDLAILSFADPLPGIDVCPPSIMSASTLRKINQKGSRKACGLAGKYLVSGQGNKDDPSGKTTPSTLKTGMFKESKLNADPTHLASKKINLKGIADQERKAKAQLGDSGGVVLGCNVDNGEFEIVGALHSMSLMSSQVEPISQSEGKEWVEMNSLPCTAPMIKADELYPSHRHLNQNIPDPNECVSVSTVLSDENVPYFKIKNQCSRKVRTRVKFRDSESRQQVVNMGTTKAGHSKLHKCTIKPETFHASSRYVPFTPTKKERKIDLDDMDYGEYESIEFTISD